MLRVLQAAPGSGIVLGMKLWIRYLVGVIIGIALAILLPEAGGDTAGRFEQLSRIAANIGRYLLFPLAFFSVIIAIHDLHEDRKALSVLGLTVGATVVAGLGLVVLGVGLMLLLSPAPIPVVIEEARAATIPTLNELVHAVFPANAFSVLAGDGRHLLPVVVLALLVGAGLIRDKRFASLLADVFDGFARLFYRLSTVIVETIAVLLVALTAALVYESGTAIDYGFYGQLFLVVGFTVAVIILGIYPLLAYLLGGRWNPFPWLYGMVAPGLAALASGDVFFSTPTLMRVGRESHGVKRSVGGVVYPVAAVLARGGTALVAAMTFVLVLRSYSPLELAVADVLWIGGAAFGASFLLATVPAHGVLVLLAFMSGAFRAGIGDAFLIVMPAIPILGGLGALLDVFTSGLIGYIAAHQHRERELIEVTDFI